MKWSNRLAYVPALCVVCCMVCVLRMRGNLPDLSRDVLRLHILANSDADYDQELKIRVKDAVASEVAMDMKRCGVGSKEEAMKHMADNSEKYVSLARKVIRDSGYDYQVKATIGRHWFPIRKYGNALYPAGEYDAYRMLIGSAEGKNWWCVLYPSLCMVDEACHIETREDDGGEEISFGFRIVEWFANLW